MPNLPQIPQSPKARAIAILVVGLAVIGIISVLVVQSRRTKVLTLDQQARTSAASGNFADAKQKLDEALKFDSSNAKLLADTITAIAAEGNATGKEAEAQTKAKPYLDQALKLNTNSAELLTAIGYLYETGGQYQGAVDYYDKALKINSKSGQIIFRKAHALQFLNGNTKEVQDLYDLAYQYDQKDPLILMFQGKKYLKAGNLDKAFSLFISAANNSKQNNLKAEAYVDAAQIKQVQNKPSEAKNLAISAVNTDRSYGPGLVLYGTILSREGNFKDAAAFIVEASSKNPRSSQPFWSLGVLMRQATNYGKSVEYLRAGIAKVDNDNTVLGNDQKNRVKAFMNYDLGKTYYMSGDVANALTAFAKAVSFDKTVAAVLKGEQFGLYSGISGDSRFTALIQ